MLHKFRNTSISIFVIAWTLLFHYESIRYYYLVPYLKRELPKTKFLFPPAGWIMFYNVGPEYSTIEVYGIKDKNPQWIDPHLIFRTRPIGYDNIHRNVMVEVAGAHAAQPFCRYLRRKFPYFDTFLVTITAYPSLPEKPFERVQKVVYECR